MARTIDLELTRAEVEVIELEARLRVVPMNDMQLSGALTLALKAKKDRLDKLRALHAAQNRPKPALVVPPKAPLAGKPTPASNGPAPKVTPKPAPAAKVVALKVAPKRHSVPKPAPKAAAKPAPKKRSKPAPKRKHAAKRPKAKTRK
jgi:hypothetical protein